jgi:hypothetical protein
LEGLALGSSQRKVLQRFGPSQQDNLSNGTSELPECENVIEYHTNNNIQPKDIPMDRVHGPWFPLTLFYIRGCKKANFDYLYEEEL